jgi:hypothetical protein
MLGKQRSLGAIPVHINICICTQSWGSYIEEVQLISCASDCICKEENISLQPRHLLRRILETDSRARHLEGRIREDENSRRVD